MDISAFSDKCFTSSQMTSIINRDLVDLQSQSNFILSDLNDQRKNGRFCDAALQCRGDTIYAHRCVLSCVSKYFETLFTTPLSTNTSPVQVVNLDEYSPQVVRLLVDLVYTQADIPYPSLIELLKLAVFLQYDKLVEYIVGVIRPLINDTNVLHWLEVAHHCGCDALIWLTECFVRENFAKLHWKAMFKGTSYDKDMLRYIQNSEMQKKTKELVHITTEDKREFILDVDKILLVPYHAEKGSHTNCMLDARSSLKFSTTYTFVRNGMIFAVSIKWKPSLLVFNLLKYSNCSSSFERIGSYDIHNRCFHERSFYDGKNCLYLQMEVNEELLIYKIDLITETLCDGYINMGLNSREEEVCQKQKLHPLCDGMYFLSLDTVVRVSDFDFDQTENHTVDRIPLYEKITGLVSVSAAKKRRFGTTYFESCNGTAYCVLPPKDCDDGDYCILKLELGKRSWTHVADIECDYVMELLCCNNTICIVTNVNVDDDTNYKEIFFFNAAEGKVEEATIELPVSCDETFFNFPIYL